MVSNSELRRRKNLRECRIRGYEMRFINKLEEIRRKIKILREQEASYVKLLDEYSRL